MKKMYKALCLVMLLCIAAALTVCGSAADVIEIKTEEDMLCLMNKVGDFADWTAEYQLTADITMTAAGKSVGGTTLKPKPIGLSGASFQGVFDGGDHTVTFKDRCYSGQFSGLFGLIEGATVKNVTVVPKANKGNEFGTLQYVGGVIAVARDNCLIENCTYKGFVANTNSACKGVGGIVGRIECHANKTVTVRGCVNNAEIAGYTYVGGIVGLATGHANGNSGVIVIENCMNTGEVRISNAGTQNAGGIIGFFRTYGVAGNTVRDCLNTGNVKTMKTCAGGIVGKANDNADNTVIERCVNTGKVYSASNSGYVHGIVAAHKKTLAVRNCFDGYANPAYSSEDDDSKGTNGTHITAGTDLTVLGNNWVIPTVGMPELAIFHTAASHGKDGVSYFANFEYDAENEAVVYICPACDTVFYTDTDLYTDVYVDVENGAPVTDTASESVGSSSAPFRLFSDAMRYAATVASAKETGVTVHLVGTVPVSDGYETPVCDEMITVTGDTLHFTEGEGGKDFFLSGPLTFRDITFTAEVGDSNTGTWIYAQNHKIVMDTGIVMGNGATVGETAGYPKGDGVKMYLHGGFLATASTEPLTMATDVTVRSGDYWLVAGWNEGGYASGTGKITVGKTDAADTLFIHYLATYSRGTNAVVGESKLTVIFDAEVNLHIFYPNTMNPPVSGYEDALYETDLLLLGDLNTTPRTAYGTNAKTDIDASASCTNTVLNVYTDMRLTKAIRDTALFDKDETDDAVQYDGTLTTVATTVNLYPYYRYCMDDLGGHFGTDACTLCGASLACEHANKVTETEANCTDPGSEYCADCGETFVTDPISEAHEYRWVATADGYALTCAYNAEHVLRSVTGKNASFFVSDKGTAAGGFSASEPANDFDAIMRLAASLTEDATVYVVGTVTMPVSSGSYEIYQEPAHENTITIRGYKDGIGTLSFGRRNVRMGYILAGDTTFENIEFSTGVSQSILYITAEHHHLTMGENISAEIHRNNSSGEAGGKVVLVGGCYQTFHEATCTGVTTHMTVRSGNYFSIIGGSANKTCDLPNGRIRLEILGDITVGNTATEKNGTTDRMFILGTQNRNCGDILLTVDGNITNRNAFCIGAYGKDSNGVWKAKNVTVQLLGGSILDYSFTNTAEYFVVYDETTYDPSTAIYKPGIGVIFPFGHDMAHAVDGGILKSLDSLTVLYDPTYAPTVSMANRFLWEFGGDEKFTLEARAAEGCTALDGRHSPFLGSESTVVEATCYNEGSATYTCTTCGETYAAVLPKLAHDFGAETLFSEATCISPAIYAAFCENDGCHYAQYTAVGDKSAEHVYVDGICKHCNADRTALCAHIFGDTETISTGCGTGTRKECTLCGKVVIDVVSTDHDFSKYVVTVEPMDIAPGIKTRTCKKCGKTETAVLYYDNNVLGDEVLAVDASGSLADFSVDRLKLTKAEKAALNALLRKSEYGSEVKISYTTDGNVVTGITYSIPMPAEYMDMQNVKVYVRDGDVFTSVSFAVERGYIVFTY